MTYSPEERRKQAELLRDAATVYQSDFLRGEWFTPIKGAETHLKNSTLEALPIKGTAFWVLAMKLRLHVDSPIGKVMEKFGATAEEIAFIAGDLSWTQAEFIFAQDMAGHLRWLAQQRHRKFLPALAGVKPFFRWRRADQNEGAVFARNAMPQ